MKSRKPFVLVALTALLLCASLSHATPVTAAADHVELIAGEILMRTAETGIIVAIDNGEAADGFVDHAFLFQMERVPKQLTTFEGTGTVLVRADRLVLTSELGEQIADLRLFQGFEARERQQSHLFGTGLSRYSNLSKLTIDELGGFDPAFLAPSSWLNENPFAQPAFKASCAAGGTGSTSCSVSDCCSVSCSSGYYACCHCTNGCTCVSDGGGGGGGVDVELESLN